MVWEMDWIGSQGMFFSFFSSPISFCASPTSPSLPPQLMAPQYGWNKDNLYHTNTGLEYRPMFLMPYQTLSMCFLYIGDFTYIDVPKLGVLLFLGGKRVAFYMSCTVISPGKKKNLTKTRTCRLDYTTSRQKKHLKKDEKEQRQLDGPPRKTPPRCGVGSASTVARGGTKVPSRDPSEVFGQWAAQAPLILHWPVWVRFIKYPIEEPLWQLATTNSCAFACCCHSSVLTWPWNPWSSSTAAGVTYRT